MSSCYRAMVYNQHSPDMGITLNADLVQMGLEAASVPLPTSSPGIGDGDTEISPPSSVVNQVVDVPVFLASPSSPRPQIRRPSPLSLDRPRSISSTNASI
jgi:hypothetical protein